MTLAYSGTSRATGRRWLIALAILLAAALVLPVAFQPALVGAAPTVIFSENFDGVAAGTLPAGWTTQVSGAANTPWRATTTTPASPPNAAFAPGNVVLPGETNLISPAIPITSTEAQLTFSHRMQLESGYDGGVLEVSSPNINGGNFTDITNPAVGGALLTNGYTHTISSNYQSAISGRRAWSGNFGYRTTTAKLGPNVNGQTIKLRWRLVQDRLVTGAGWWVDDIQIIQPDATPPVISGVPANITQFVTTGTGGAVITYTSPTAVDDVDGPVPVVCTPPSGSTFPLGVTTVACSATDAAGNEATASFDVTILYNFSGFFQPVDNPGSGATPVYNRTKAGQAIPVKFSLGGNQGLSIFQEGSPASKVVDCATGAPIDALEETVTAGQSTLQYDSATGQYTYVWKTDKAWANSCRLLSVMLNDGTEHVAYFNFTR